MKLRHKVFISGLLAAACWSSSSAQWVHCSGADSLIVTGFASDGATLFVSSRYGTRTGGVLVSSDSGMSWTMLESSMAIQPGIGLKWFNALAVRGSELYVSYVDGISHSSDHGVSWRVDTSGLGYNPWVEGLFMTDSAIYAPVRDSLYRKFVDDTAWVSVGAVAPVALVNTIPFAQVGEFLFFGDRRGIRRSTDVGTTWSQVNLPSGYEGGNGVLNLVPTRLGLFTSSGYGVRVGGGCLSGSVCCSLDTGRTWTRIMEGLPEFQSADIDCLAEFFPFDVKSIASAGDQVFAGTNKGVLLLDNAHSTWIPVSMGLTDSSVAKLFVWGDNLLAGTTNAGIWRRPLSEMTTSVDDPPRGLPTTCSLEQNYPNPFNSSTMISFSLPRRMHVLLEVFNSLGQRVSVLADGEFTAGYHGLLFTGSNLSSGAYVYRLRAGTFAETRSMLLVR